MGQLREQNLEISRIINNYFLNNNYIDYKHYDYRKTFCEYKDEVLINTKEYNSKFYYVNIINIDTLINFKGSDQRELIKIAKYLFEIFNFIRPNKSCNYLFKTNIKNFEQYSSDKKETYLAIYKTPFKDFETSFYLMTDYEINYIFEDETAFKKHNIFNKYASKVINPKFYAPISITTTSSGNTTIGYQSGYNNIISNSIPISIAPISTAQPTPLNIIKNYLIEREEEKVLPPSKSIVNYIKNLFSKL